MSNKAESLFPTNRLKYVISLRRSRSGDSIDDRPYIGLEDIESWTGKHLTDSKAINTELSAVNVEISSLTNTFEPGDVLFGKLRPYLAKTWVADFPGRSTTELLVMQPLHIEPRFLMYVCLWQDFIDSINASTFGSKMPRADWDYIGNMKIPVPSRATQRAISDYLDHETRQIDEMIAAKERLLELIAERRITVITHAVTQGINPDAPLRNAGISWLDKVPAHWGVERTKLLFSERDSRSVSGEEELLTVSHLTGVTPRSEKDVNMFEAETNEGYKICFPGDLVINTLWAWMGAMGVAPVKGIVSPAYNVYQPRELLDPAYVDALVRLPIFAREVIRYSKGVWSSRLRLYPEGFYEVSIPVPPREEQLAIVEHIARETKRLRAVQIAAERTIALLKERRAALIAAAVTGEIDVEGAI